MIQEVTEAMVKVTGEEKRDGNWVLIEETNPSEWAIGGKPVGLP
jgi:phenylpyruvate tautomerase PptA (4-oxalocrotonate tautomerase family)